MRLSSLRHSIRYLSAKNVSTRNVVLVDSARTPFCVAGTDYRNVMAYELQTAAITNLIKKTGISKDQIQYVCIGTVIQEPKTHNIAREVLLTSGLSNRIPAHTVSMACISSNQSITSMVELIKSGVYDTAIAGGVDIMSDVPIRYNKTLRKYMLGLSKVKNKYLKALMALRILDPRQVLNPELPAVTEFSSGETMGHSADRLSAAFSVSRQEQDEFALRSHTLAAKAQADGKLKDVHIFQNSLRDNGVRPSPLSTLAKLKPSFVRPHGTITAGNSSFLTDGASACLLMSEEKAKELGLKPKAFLREYNFHAQDPKDELLLGPSYCIPRLLAQGGRKLKDFDVFEVHEAFAGQLLANLKALSSNYFCERAHGMSGVGEIPLEKLNLWGGSLSIGHPFGATGVRLVTHAANRLIEEDGNLALVSACAAGGQGHAMVVERCR